MYDIFLSYSSPDKEWVSQLARRIATTKFQERHLRVWFDEEQLHAGDRLRPEIEAAIDASLYLGIVLTPQSINSSWVNFELAHFYSKNRESAIIPLIREDCDIPVLLRDYIRINFTDMDKYEIGLEKLIKRLCLTKAPALDQVYAEVTDLLTAAINVYNGQFPNYTTSESDALFDYLQRFDINDNMTEGLVFGAFEAMFDYLETLSYEAAYNPTMLVAECLASLITKSISYNRIIQNWHNKDIWMRLMAAIRAYSKLAEIDPTLVDSSGILYHAASLDRKKMLSRQEEVIWRHMVRTIGKIKDTMKGELLIETLAKRKSISKKIAAGAISIEPSDSDPIYLLSYLKNLEKRPVEKKEPSQRILKVLSMLLQDPDSAVRQIAIDTANELKHSHPDIKLESIPSHQKKDVSTIEIQIRNGHHLPFNGNIYKVNSKNIASISMKIHQFTIYCLEEMGLSEVHFFGTSGLLIPDQAAFSHQCISLMNNEIPYAMVKDEDMEKIPHGRYAVVEEDGMLRIQ